MAVAWLLLLSFLAPAAHQPCAGSPSAPKLDHVILVVRDLDRAAAAFEAHGFRIKPGRLHPNNLLNKHIKFRDGSEIELMTVKGRGLDGMARGYQEMLAAGEGGVYLAMSAADPAALRAAAVRAQLVPRQRNYGPWTFTSFPASAASAVFFTSGGSAPVDPEALVSHAPDVTGLADVWVEAGPELGELLAALGASNCGPAPRSDGPPGTRWALARGSVVIVPPRNPARRRLLGATLQRRATGGAKIYPHPAFWLRYQ